MMRTRTKATYHQTSPHEDTHTLIDHKESGRLHLVEITDDRLSDAEQPTARFYIVNYNDQTGDMTARCYCAKGWKPQAVAYVAGALTERQAERRFAEITRPATSDFED
jgi:hypothetical protein